MSEASRVEAPPAAAPATPPPSRLRAFVQRLASSRFALFFMCVLSFADACCSPILPEVLYVPMVLLRPAKRWVYAFWCSLASVLGGVAGYALGFWLWEHGLREFAFAHVPGFTPEWFARVSDYYGGNAFLWVWLGGFTPLPYKIFTVFAGVCYDKVDFWVFVVASVTSRFPRIYLTVWLLDRLGKPTFDWLMRRSSGVVLVLLLLVLALVVFLQLR